MPWFKCSERKLGWEKALDTAGYRSDLRVSCPTSAIDSPCSKHAAVSVLRLQYFRKGGQGMKLSLARGHTRSIRDEIPPTVILIAYEAERRYVQRRSPPLHFKSLAKRRCLCRRPLEQCSPATKAASIITSHSSWVHLGVKPHEALDSNELERLAS